MNNRLVSIIMPVKNAGNWVSDTLESVLNQTYEQWELIAIDDHSTDESFKIIENFASIDSRIQILRNKSFGIIPALQFGLSMAKGKFITRMDADDIMTVDRLNLLVKAIESSAPKTIITGRVEYFPKPITEGYLKYQNWLNERNDRMDHYDHIYRECIVASPNWLARTQEMREEGNWDELSYPEDYDMVFKWLKKGFIIKGINHTTLLWREHPARTSRNSAIYDQESFFNLKLSWFKELNPHLNRKIALFGAGQKGKIVAKFFTEHNIPFSWYDQHFKRYNNALYGKAISDPEDAKEEVAVFCINPELQESLQTFFTRKEYAIGKNAWFF